MSVEHKRPLMAFVIVALICGMVIGHALMSQAVPSLLARPFEVAQGMVFPAAASEVVAGEVFHAAPAAAIVPAVAAPTTHPSTHSNGSAAGGKAGHRGRQGQFQGHQVDRSDHAGQADHTTGKVRSQARRTSRLTAKLDRIPLRAARHWHPSWRHGS